VLHETSALNVNARGNILCRVTLALAESGDTGLARRLLSHAEREAGEVQVSDFQAQAFARLAQSFILLGELDLAAGYVDRAQQVTARIEYEPSKMNAMTEVACALAAAGRGGDAGALIDEILPSLYSLDGSDRVARALVLSADYERGFQVARERIENLRAASTALTQANDLEHLEQLLSFVRAGGKGLLLMRELSSIAQAFVRAGEPTRGLDVAGEAFSICQSLDNARFAGDQFRRACIRFRSGRRRSSREKRSRISH
jgi:hypothetical protein